MLLEPLFGLLLSVLLGVLVVELLEVLDLVSVLSLPFASVVLWCFLCFLVVVVLPLASVDVELVVWLCVVSVEGALDWLPD